ATIELRGTAGTDLEVGYDHTDLILHRERGWLAGHRKRTRARSQDDTGPERDGEVRRHRYAACARKLAELLRADLDRVALMNEADIDLPQGALGLCQRAVLPRAVRLDGRLYPTRLARVDPDPSMEGVYDDPGCPVNGPSLLDLRAGRLVD